jgi:hypothetical protein
MTAARETTLKELGDMLAHVVDHMATKGDIGDVKGEIANIRKTMVTKEFLREELAPVHAELKSIRRYLDDLRQKVENVVGFRKEIDHALERVAALEKRLGIDKKIAA